MGGIMGKTAVKAKAATAAKEELSKNPPEKEQPTRRSREDASALRARRRRGGMRSLLSPSRADGVSGMSDKLSGS